MPVMKSGQNKGYDRCWGGHIAVPSDVPMTCTATSSLYLACTALASMKTNIQASNAGRLSTNLTVLVRFFGSVSGSIYCNASFIRLGTP